MYSTRQPIAGRSTPTNGRAGAISPTPNNGGAGKSSASTNTTAGAAAAQPFPPTLSSRRVNAPPPANLASKFGTPPPGFAQSNNSAPSAATTSARQTSTMRRSQSPRLAGGQSGSGSASANINTNTNSASGAPSRNPLPLPRGISNAQVNIQLEQQQPVYTVGNMPSAGSLFVAITAALVARGDWVVVEPPGLKEVKATPMPGTQGASNPCCSKLKGVNLFMGDKTIAEKLMAEARIVGLRAKRNNSFSSSSAPNSASSSSARLVSSSSFSCGHSSHRGTQLSPPLVPATASDANVVNFMEGSRCITMKSRMVRTLMAFYQRRPQLRLMRYLYEYLPVTFILTPLNPSKRLTSAAYIDERDAMIDTMKTINDDSPDGTVSAWIAKCSNGCHGDGIKIVRATSGGLRDLLSYIDGFSDGISWVVCRYIDRPLLYKRRKFDIRVWVLLMEDGRVYMHRDLVMRLSSVPYNPALITTDTKEGLLANITNHCIQTTSDTYGVDESGNELWWDSLQRLLLETAPHNKSNNNHSASSSPTRSPPRRGGAAGAGAGLESLPADEACLLQMQRIIVESFSATKETMGVERGMMLNGPATERSIDRPSATTLAAVNAVGGVVVNGMPATRDGVVPYPTAFNGAAGGGNNPFASATVHVAGASSRGGNTAAATFGQQVLSTPSSAGSTTSHQNSTNTVNNNGFKKIGVESFQVFGYDFLIDSSHRVWLLEINGSPGVADKLMKGIVDDTIATAIDPKFPPLNTNVHQLRNGKSGTTNSSSRASGGGGGSISSNGTYVRSPGVSPSRQQQQGGSPPRTVLQSHPIPSNSSPNSPSRGASPGRGQRTNGYEMIYGPGVNKAMQYYNLMGASGKGFE